MGRPRNEKRRELEKSIGVSARRVQQLMKELGLEGIEDIEVLKRWEKRISIALKTLQAQEREHDLERKRRDVIPRAEAEKYGMQIAHVVERFLDEGRTNWPTEHSGKTELQLQTLYDSSADEFKDRLREAVANI